MMTPVELNQKGFQVLVEGLGYVDAIRFLKLFDNGSEDYTKERHQWLEQLSFDEILADIQLRQQQSEG